MVERSAPYLVRGIARAFERQAIAYVLVNEGETTERMGGDGEQQGAAIRQVQQILLRPNHAGEQP